MKKTKTLATKAEIKVELHKTKNYKHMTQVFLLVKVTLLVMDHKTS